MRPEIENIQNEFVAQYPELELIRKKSYVYDIVCKGLIGVGVLVVFSCIIDGSGFYAFLSFFGLIAFALLVHHLTISRLDYEKYFNSKKSVFVERVIKLIDSSFEYIPETIPYEDLHNTELFKEKWLKEGKVNVRDYIKGTYRGVQTSIVELNFGQKGDVQAGTNFKPSLLFIADFNKKILANTFVEDKTLERDQINNVMKGLKGENIVLENPEFEVLFRTISTDEVEARYIFSYSFMERLMEFKLSLKEKEKVYVSFSKSKVSILIYEKTIFEPNISKSILEDDSFSKFYTDILSILEIIDVLRLNENIWIQSAAHHSLYEDKAIGASCNS